MSTMSTMSKRTVLSALVTFADWFDPRQRAAFNPDGKHFPMYDANDPSV